MTREARASLKDWATIFSLIALPIILAAGSWVIQDRIATQGVQKDYVQLAIEILRQRELKDDGDSAQLRTWAVKVVDAYAPVALTPEARTELIESGFGAGFDARSYAPGAFARGGLDSGWSTGIFLIPLTKEQCHRFYPMNNDPKWLERCLAYAAEAETKDSSHERFEAAQSMIKPLTVFVVGAGASVPFKFPSGLSLLRDAKVQKASQISQRIHEKVHGEDLRQFCEMLRDCQEMSLDAALESQPPILQASGKWLIADQLLRCEATSRGVAADGGDWIQHLFSLMADGVGNTADFLYYNAVWFVTYNYDRLIEHKLIAGLRSKYRQDWLSHKHKILERVVHLHGSLGDLNEESQNHVPFGAVSTAGRAGTEYDRDLTGFMPSCERSIRIVHEVQDNEQFSQARGLLMQAERVFFLGFGFGVKNVDRLNLSCVNEKASVCYTRYGMTDQEWAYYIREPFNRAKIKNTRDSNPTWDSLQLIREHVGELVTRY